MQQVGLKISKGGLLWFFTNNILCSINWSSKDAFPQSTCDFLMVKGAKITSCQNQVTTQVASNCLGTKMLFI